MSEAGGTRVDLRIDARADGTIAYLTVDNRAKLNTLDRALMTEFIGKVERLAARDDLRALVLTGAGDKAFIGGASIPEMAALDRDSAEGFITLLHRTCDALRQLPVPVIARHRRLRTRCRTGSGGVLRSAGRLGAREIRHAGGEGRHSLGGRGRAASRPDRLRPRA